MLALASDSEDNVLFTPVIDGFMNVPTAPVVDGLQPKKAIAPSGSSLKTCGLDTCLPVIGGQPGPAVGGQPSPAVGGQPAGGGQPAQPAVGGNMYLQIDLPHAFVHGGVVSVSGMSARGLLTRKCFKRSHAWSCCVIWWCPRQHASACTQVVSAAGRRKWRSFG